uniref:Phenol hydroxylase large subunit n=1 Tax=Parastrongyloides trichosuri TaxID=131310 RepID=A0A0N5A5N6_PARTI
LEGEGGRRRRSDEGRRRLVSDPTAARSRDFQPSRRHPSSGPDGPPSPSRGEGRVMLSSPQPAPLRTHRSGQSSHRRPARHARILGRLGVRGAVADHDAARRIAARLLHRLNDVRAAGLAGRDRIRASDEGEMARQPQRLDQRHRQVRALVGRHAQDRPARAQAVQRRDAAVERAALVGDVSQVVLDETLEQTGRMGLVPGGARFHEAVAQHGHRAVPDQMSGRRHGHGRQLILRQHPVQRADQVGRRVHQRPVQIEGDGPAFQVALNA